MNVQQLLEFFLSLTFSPSRSSFHTHTHSFSFSPFIHVIQFRLFTHLISHLFSPFVSFHLLLVVLSHQRLT